MEDNPSTPTTPTPEAKPTPAPEPTPTPEPTPAAPVEPATPAEPVEPAAPAASAEPATPTAFTASEPAPATPVEPAVPVTPTENPATPAATPPVDNPAKPQKKINKPLIIGASAAAALLVGGGIAFAIYRTQPELVALDAVSNFLSAENVTTSGSVDITSDSDIDSSTFGVKSIVVNFVSETSGANNSTEATAVATMNDDSKISLDFGETFMSDGKLYLKVSGIKEAIDALPQEYSETVGQYLGNIVDRIDGTWWEVSLSDILEASKDTISETYAKQIQAVYDCGLQTLEETRSSDEIADLYKDHRFIQVENYSGSDIQASNGGSLYAISLNNEELASFTKGIGDTAIANNFVTCINNVEGMNSEIKASDAFKDVKADDFKEISENLPDLVLEANPWTHNLTGFHASYVYDGNQNSTSSTIKETTATKITAKTDLSFDYGAVSVSVPDGKKSILELTDFVEAAGGDASYFLMLVPGVGLMTLTTMSTSAVNVSEPVAVEGDVDIDVEDFDDTDDYGDAEDESDFADEDEDEEFWEEYDD